MKDVETIGADLGGTKLAVGVVNASAEITWKDEVPSRGYSQEEVIDLLVREVERARAARPGAGAVGLGIPARINFESGQAIDTVNLDFEKFPVKDLIEEKTGLPTFVDNDGNLAMLAEALHGAARGSRNALMLTLGTGIGGGVWIDGKIFRGATGAGAELGHVVVEIDGPPCQGNCPGRGCVEVFASGTGIGRMGQEAAIAVPNSALGKIAATGTAITAREVKEAAEAGDEAASGVVERVGHYLGTALVSLSNIFEPEIIVLGGGAMALGELLLEPTRREVSTHALSPMNETPVVAAELGPAAGMIGAASAARVGLEAGI
ncbi:MAG: ROK family protein [Solirubrobacterales bacterium]